MRERTESCVVGIPLASLRAHLADYCNVIRLATSECSARRKSGTAGTAGALYEASMSWEGLESRFEVVLQESSPERITWVGTGPGSTSAIRFDLEAEDETRTAVTVKLTMSFSETMYPLEPFGWALLDRGFGRLLQRLEQLRMLESSPQQA